MSIGAPRLADGVECRAAGRRVLLANPSRDAHVTVSLDQANLVRGLDGSRSVESLRTEFGESVTTLLAELREDGFLADYTPPVSNRRFCLTAQGIEVEGVDGLARALHRRLRAMCTRPGACVAAGLTGVALAFGLRTHQTVGLPPVSAALTLLVAAFLLTAVHELGHAVACAHFGRRLGRAGIGFYWGSLAAYVDATDALMLPRGPRIVEAAAGPLAEGAVGGIAALASVIARGYWAGACREAAVLAAVSIVVNLVPFLELDGAWILADLFDRPTVMSDPSESRAGSVAAVIAFRALAGVALLAIAIAAWWTTFGHTIAYLWRGALLHRALAVALVAPVGAGLVLGLLQALVGGALRRAGELSPS